MERGQLNALDFEVARQPFGAFAKCGDAGVQGTVHTR
jgi:hypothetical protein